VRFLAIALLPRKKVQGIDEHSQAPDRCVRVENMSCQSRDPSNDHRKLEQRNKRVLRLRFRSAVSLRTKLFVEKTKVVADTPRLYMDTLTSSGPRGIYSILHHCGRNSRMSRFHMSHCHYHPCPRRHHILRGRHHCHLGVSNPRRQVRRSPRPGLLAECRGPPRCCRKNVE
jgi:hypothetical protein